MLMILFISDLVYTYIDNSCCLFTSN